MSATDLASIEHRLDDHSLGNLLAAADRVLRQQPRDRSNPIREGGRDRDLGGYRRVSCSVATRANSTPTPRTAPASWTCSDVTGAVVEFETRMLDPQGQPSWTALSGRILPRAGSDLVVMAWRSIAVRKAAQERADSLLASVKPQNAELELRVAERARELAAARDELARSRQQPLDALEAMSEGFVLWDADVASCSALPDNGRSSRRAPSS